MEDDFEVYKGKNFSDLCREIHRNSQQTRNQIDVLITELRQLIKGVNDAMIIVPLIRDYIDVGVKNDDHLIKLANVVTRIAKKQQNSPENSSLTDSEREELLLAVEEYGKQKADEKDFDVDSVVNNAKEKIKK